MELLTVIRFPRARGSGKTAVAGAACLAIVVLFAGCSHTRTWQPAVNPDTLGDIEFIHYLETVPVVSYGEACRAVTILREGDSHRGDQEEPIARLQEQGIVRAAWGLEPDDALDLGTLAYMLAATCNLPPSVDSTLFGSWGLGDRRYALRRAVDHEIVYFGPPYKLVTGGEMVFALGRADDYMAKNGIYATERHLTPRPDR